MGESLLNRISGSSLYHSDLQQRVDGLVGGFVRQATDGSSLAAFIAGGLAYRSARAGILGWGEGGAVRAASVGLGLTAEVSAFEFIHRSFSSDSRRWRWNGPGGLAQGLLQDGVTFGALKGAGSLAGGENFIAQHLLQDSAVVWGHRVAASLGLAPLPAGTLAEQYLQAEAANLQMAAGLSLGHPLAPGMAALEKGLDLSTRASSLDKEALRPRDRPTLQEAWAFSGAAPVRGKGDFKEALPTPRPLLMGQTGEGRGKDGPSRAAAELNLKILKRQAKKNSAEAYEALEDLARGGDYAALCVLADLAKSRVAAIFSLIKVAEGGDIHAWTKLKALNPEDLVARPGWLDPARGRRSDAFLYLAGIGNRHALEILVRDATWYMNRGSLDLLFSLAQLGHFDAIRGISEAACRNPRAVELLARLADENKGIVSPRIYLSELDPRYYESTLRMEHFEMARPLGIMARFGNREAFSILSELASRYVAVVKVLAALAELGRDDALSELGKALQSPNAEVAREAAIALNALANKGSKKALALLPKPTLVRMVDLPPRTVFGRVWRLYSSLIDKLWTWR